jgi:hypothetical protein
VSPIVQTWLLENSLLSFCGELGGLKNQPIASDSCVDTEAITARNRADSIILLASGILRDASSIRKKVERSERQEQETSTRNPNF